MYFFLDAFVVIYTPLSWCNRGESNLVSKDKWGVEKKWGGQGDDGVRRSTEFDSSSCQRCCIIDVPRILHCRRDSQCVTSRPVLVCHSHCCWCVVEVLQEFCLSTPPYYRELLLATTLGLCCFDRVGRLSTNWHRNSRRRGVLTKVVSVCDSLCDTWLSDTNNTLFKQVCSKADVCSQHADTCIRLSLGLGSHMKKK